MFDGRGTRPGKTGGTLMDWKLVGLMALLVTPGLLAGVVGMLGFTRAEKLLGAAYHAGFAALLVLAVLNDFFSRDVAKLQTKADCDMWLERMDCAHRVANGIIWFCVSAVTAFCVVAVVHIWRERFILWKKLQVKFVMPGRTRRST